VVVRRNQVRRRGWVIKIMEAQVRKYLMDCKCPVSRGIVVQEQDHVGDLSAALFLQNILQLHQQRLVILRVDSLALRKIINEEVSILIPKNRAENFPATFCTRIFFFCGGMSHYATTPLIVALSPSHSDITRFRPWSLIARRNCLDCVEKIPNISQTPDIFDVFDSRSGISVPTSRRASACPYLNE
jgi:hypothetical protein